MSDHTHVRIAALREELRRLETPTPVGINVDQAAGLFARRHPRRELDPEQQRAIERANALNELAAQWRKEAKP